MYVGNKSEWALNMKLNFCCLLLSASESQPHSLYSLFKETNLVNPVTMRAASFWISSRISELWAAQPSQTIEAYSKTGNRYEKYIWFKAFRLNENLSYRMIPRTFAAEVLTLCIWSVHLPSYDSVRPRCLWLSTNYMCVLSNVRTGMWSKFLRVNKIASVLEGLNVTRHCLAHCDKSIRSWFMRPWILSRLDAE